MSKVTQLMALYLEPCNVLPRDFANNGPDDGLQRIIASGNLQYLSSKMALFLYDHGEEVGEMVYKEEQVFNWLYFPLYLISLT